MHALRALGSQRRLGRGSAARRGLQYVRDAQGERGEHVRRRWKGASLFAIIQAVAGFDLPAAGDILRIALAAAAPRQRRNGTFGAPCRTERVLAVLLA